MSRYQGWSVEDMRARANAAPVGDSDHIGQRGIEAPPHPHIPGFTPINRPPSSVLNASNGTTQGQANEISPRIQGFTPINRPPSMPNAFTGTTRGQTSEISAPKRRKTSQQNIATPPASSSPVKRTKSTKPSGSSYGRKMSDNKVSDQKKLFPVSNVTKFGDYTASKSNKTTWTTTEDTVKASQDGHAQTTLESLSSLSAFRYNTQPHPSNYSKFAGYQLPSAKPPPARLDAAAREAPVVQDAPTAQDAPLVQDASLVQNAPVIQSIPLVQSTCVVQTTPFFQDVPATTAAGLSEDDDFPMDDDVEAEMTKLPDLPCDDDDDDEFLMDDHEVAEMMNLPEPACEVQETFPPPSDLPHISVSDDDGSREMEKYDSSLQYSPPPRPALQTNRDITGDETSRHEVIDLSATAEVGEEDWSFVRPRKVPAHDNPPSPHEGGELSNPIQVNRVAPVPQEVAKITADDHQPLPLFARPEFPKPIRDRSPIHGVSSDNILRTCFRIGEAFRVGNRSTSLPSLAIELFARVTFSSREPGTTKQHFQFVDLFLDRPPFPKGVLENYKISVLQDSESKRFLEDTGGESKMARCLCRMRRDVKDHSWTFVIIQIRPTDWEEVRWTKKIAGYGGIKSEGGAGSKL